MKFKIESENGILVADGLDKNADAIRLREGTPAGKEKKPIDLKKGEVARVVYPLEKRKATYTVTRTE